MKQLTLEEVLRLCGIPESTIVKNTAKLRAAQPEFEAILLQREHDAMNRPSGDGGTMLEIGDPQEDQSITGKLLKLQPIVDCDGSPQDIIAAVINNRWRRDTMILMPSGGQISARVVFAVCALLRQHRHCGFVNICDTLVQRARNLCVDEFLRSGAQWSLWVDSDVVVPFGVPGFFYKDMAITPRQLPPDFAGMNTLTRLRSHDKSIVGGVYRQRRDNAKLVIQPHLNSRGAADDSIVHQLTTKGPIDKLIEVDYVATGCALVHADVYRDIIASHPERARDGHPFDFFGHDMATSGEDIAFCKLAKAAGHQSYLDCGLWCAHVGNFAYMPLE